LETANEEFFDTSVMAPVFYGPSSGDLARFIQFEKSTGCCGAHSLAEVYSTLTRMPVNTVLLASRRCFSSATFASVYPSLLWTAMNTPIDSSLRLVWVLWAVLFMTRCLRIAPSKPRPKSSTAGRRDIMPSADPRSPFGFAHLNRREHFQGLRKKEKLGNNGRHRLRSRCRLICHRENSIGEPALKLRLVAELFE
jgi:hypothetical protein